MKNWKKCKLGDVCDLVAGFAFKSKSFGNFSQKVVKISNIQPPSIDDKLDGVCLSDYNEEKLRKYLIQNGDFCLAMTGATIGKMGRYKGTNSVYLNQRVLTFRPKKDINRDFLYYCLSNWPFQAFIKNHIDSETAQPNISSSSIGKFQILCPSLDEQKRIAEILGAFDDKIELLQKQNKTLEDMAKALFKCWFVDFSVVRAKQQGLAKADIMREYHLTEELYNLFPSSFADSPLGPIPSGWEVKNVGELLAFSIGGGWGNEEESESFPIKAPVIRGTDIPSLRSSGAYNDVPVRFHKKSNHTSRELKEGDIVLEVAGGSKGQPVGRALFVSDYIIKSLSKVICASFCKLLRPNKKLLLSELFYLYLDMMYQTGEIEQYQVQSTGISNFQFKQFCEDKQFVIPNTELQKKLSLNVYIDKIGNNKKQIQTLTELRDTLLPRLISGKIRV
ncbi:restriction endonuclease subunit S [Candidatus Avelusimicrobium facis]|uniref:restriction endonuclease subunit S n=1 Tax=Candidatus Avelusimicrobium facis TaxID=3416203 RepID=UPI003D098E37